MNVKNYLDAWIEREFAGYGLAMRRIDEPPIPGEPLMSMVEAKELTRRAVAEFARSGLDDAIQAIRAGRDDRSCGEDYGKIVNSVLNVAEDRINNLKRIHS
jgi:hypothetical protein